MGFEDYPPIGIRKGTVMIYDNGAMSLFDEWWSEEVILSSILPKEAALKAWEEQAKIVKEISGNEPVLDFETWWLTIPSSPAKESAEKAWDVLEELISELETELHLKDTPWDM